MSKNRGPWDASIDTADESYTESLSKAGNDGNRTYSPSGTYGQSDYTVRARTDGTYDVYVTSDSDRGHSHDHIDSNGNLLDRYHDYIIGIFDISQLEKISKMSKDECIKNVKILLKNK